MLSEKFNYTFDWIKFSVKLIVHHLRSLNNNKSNKSTRKSVKNRINDEQERKRKKKDFICGKFINRQYKKRKSKLIPKTIFFFLIIIITIELFKRNSSYCK